MVGIKDVAAQAGVSISTVSYALSGKRRISPEVRQHILQTARELGYFPHGGPLSSPGKRTGFLAVSDPIRPTTTERTYAGFLMNVVKSARERGYDTIVLSESGEQAQTRLEQVTDAGLVDGVILLDADMNDSRVSRAAISSVPYVAVGVPHDTAHLACVDLDFERACNAAVDRLSQLGHRDCIFFGSAPDEYRRRSNFIMRSLGSLQHYARKNDMTLKGYAPPADSSDAGTWAIGSIDSLLEKAFAAQPDATAIIVQSDLTFVEALIGRLALMGKRVPHDVSVLSLTTLGDADRLSTPIDELPLQPERTCSRAIDMMMDILAGHGVPMGTVERLEIPYLDRGSVTQARRNPSK
ncbi:LacI family DNA-binding transcriptional regulator [Bifidobacterium callimiconis]|uniref:Periplasmic binding protein-like domain-containing protein n=1 Tax=Bifidobacterium callimiconis TaxID=2306973 RepID=A0A430FH14_9BIFI|nr:LacI family DNA-binding transcriptional regulator [Bifidobacterium callimiconis]RSX52008.1 Periplasmic binding protein-like domain-containing protein [Bifidobacterium callimiconis]